MRPNSTDRSNCAWPVKPLAMAKISQGIATCASSVSAISTVASPLSASSAKPCGWSSVSNRLENIGTKAMLKAPSAKKRRNMLGSRKATT